jgi:hypothetical protein
VRYYTRAEIERFLRAVDQALKNPTTVVVIGGAAAAVKYRIEDPTTDIDTFNAVTAELRRALAVARQSTGLPMPVEQSGVADGPYHFEDRLLHAMPRLPRLTVLVPERHDLALMKTVRGDPGDFVKLKAIHQRKPFDLAILIRRYEEEMDHVVIDPRRLTSNFLGLVESLFPDARHLVQNALGHPDLRGRLDAYLLAQAPRAKPSPVERTTGVRRKKRR